MVIEFSNYTKYKTPKAKFSALANALWQEFRGEETTSISVALVGPARMRTINRRYRGHDQATDVLSFRGGEAMGNVITEIILCPLEIFRLKKYQEVFPDYPDFSARNLNDRKRIRLEQYLLAFVFVHGLLHLIGYDDVREKDRLRMVSLGREFLARQKMVL